MNDLGNAILVAMRDQGWLVLFDQGVRAIAVMSPRGSVRVVPYDIWHDQDDQRMRIILMALIVVDGLQWPWPPDHDDEVYGETPRYDA